MSGQVDCMACIALGKHRHTGPAGPGTITDNGVTHEAMVFTIAEDAVRWCMFDKHGFAEKPNWGEDVISINDPRYSP